MTRKMVSLAFFLLRLGVKLGSSLLFHYLFGSIASMLMILRAALIFGIHPSCSSFCHGGRVVGCFFFFAGNGNGTSTLQGSPKYHPPPSDSCGTKER